MTKKEKDRYLKRVDMTEPQLVDCKMAIFITDWDKLYYLSHPDIVWMARNLQGETVAMRHGEYLVGDWEGLFAVYPYPFSQFERVKKVSLLFYNFTENKENGN